MSYITMQELANQLGTREYRIDLTGLGGTGNFASGDVLTGGTTGTTATIVRYVSDNEVYCNLYSGKFQLGETVSNAGGRTGVIIGDEYLVYDSFLNEAHDIIRSYIGYDYLDTGTTRTERFTASPKRNVYNLTHYPVKSITEIKLNGDTITPTYLLDSNNGIIDFKGYFSRYFYRQAVLELEITYVSGFSDSLSVLQSKVPYALKRAQVMLVQRLYAQWQKQVSMGGFDSLSIGGQSLSMGDKPLIDDTIERLIRPFRRWGFG